MMQERERRPAKVVQQQLLNAGIRLAKIIDENF
jgi:hypothetical protein